MWNDLKTIKKALNSANLGLWEWDLITNKIELNDTALEIHDLKNHENDRNFKSFIRQINPDDRNKFISEFKGPIVYRIETEKGLVKWVEATGIAVKDKNKNLTKITGTCIDITSKIEAQERLNAQLTIFNELAKSTSLKEISEKLLMIISTTFGWDFGVMWLRDDDGLTVLKTTWPKGINLSSKIKKNGNKIVSKFLMPIESNSKVEGALEFYSVSGKPRYETSIAMLNAIKNNIGQVLEKQKILKEKGLVRKQLQTIFNNVPFGITVENEDGDIINANVPLTEIFNKPSDFQFIGKNIKEIFSEYKILNEDGDELKFSERPAKKTLHLLKEVTETLCFINKGTGNKKYISVKASLIDGATNEKVILKTFKDLTNSLEDQKQRDFFVGVLGHELKNPLASIKAYAQLLKRRSENKTDKIYIYSDSIESQAERLVKLIGNMFDLTRFTSGKFDLNKRKLDIDSTIKKIIDNYKLTVPYREIQLTANSNAKILVDEDRLAQVIINLLSNANKYSAKTKPIIVTVSVYKGFAEIVVKDFGIGIPKKYQSEIFKLFRVIPPGKKNYRHGLGMGLAITRGIVRAHGGEVLLQSKIGEGSEFKIRLPYEKFKS